MIYIQVTTDGQKICVGIEETIHKGLQRIKLVFVFNRFLIDVVKKIPGRLWSKTMNCWHIPYRKDYIAYLVAFFKSQGLKPEEKIGDESPVNSRKIENPWPNPNEIPGFYFDGQEEKKQRHILDDKGKTSYKAFLQVMELKRLSVRTCEIYSRFFVEFLEKNKGKDIDQLSYRNLYDYVNQVTAGLSHTGLKQCISAIKFYYEKVLGRQRMFFNLRKEITVDCSVVHIPFYQLKKIIEKVTSSTDRLLLMLVYFLNLSEEEICSIQLKETVSLLNHRQISNNNNIKGYFSILIKEHINKTSNRKYLFEDTNDQFVHEKLTWKIKLYFKEAQA